MTSRLRADEDERVLVAAVGAHLTKARNSDLAATRRGDRANDRYKVLVERFGIQSRYAGTICVDNDAATKAAIPRSACGCGQRCGCGVCRDGYSTPKERFQKQRRLGSRVAELARVETKLATKDYPVVYGGRRLAGTRHHLAKAGLTTETWRTSWSEARSWFGCAGNVGKPGGNPCLTLNRGQAGLWYLTISVPNPVAEQFGVQSRVQVRHPVALHHRSRELEQRLAERLAVRVDVEPRTDKKGRPAHLPAGLLGPAGH